MNRNRAKKYLREKGIEEQRIEMPNGGIQLHNLLADFEMYCMNKLKYAIDQEAQYQLIKEGYRLRRAFNRRNKREIFEEIEIRQGKDGEPRYILNQKQFDRL